MNSGKIDNSADIGKKSGKRRNSRRNRLALPAPLLPTSLKGRLLLLAAVVVLVGLGLFAAQLSAMFRQHVMRGERAAMELHLEQLIVALQRAPDDDSRRQTLLPEPRFMRPLSGYYWQVNDAGGQVLARSRSLWDATLPAPPAPPPARGALWFETTGPTGERLLVLARRIILPRGMLAGTSTPPAAAKPDSEGETAALFMVAHDRIDTEAALQAFRRDLLISLGILAAVLLAALLAQVWLGLRPLTVLRRQIADIRKGKRQQLEMPAVAEIGDTVAELNKLLRQQQQHMEQARARASNLAHGLKTPLAALSALARDLLEAGQEDKARAVLHQVALLGQQVQHELSRARVRGGAGAQGAQTPLRPAIDKLLHTLRTLHGDSGLRWRVDVADGLALRMAEGDVLELLGNLLDNAAKWARVEVRVQARMVSGNAAQAHDVPAANGAMLEVMVEDDGPGVPPHKCAEILQRGVRLDESVPGSGLGLAIVQEIVAAYGGELSLRESDIGGLRVAARLPAA